MIHRLTRRNFLRRMATLATGLVIPGWGKTSGQEQKPFQVGVNRLANYEPEAVKRELTALLDNLGGISDIVSPGAKVAIKVNLTGGDNYTHLVTIPPTESYITHPAIVRALGELLRDAGAKELYIVESIFDANSFKTFGYAGVAKTLDAHLIDLNQAAPYEDFVPVPVSDNALEYENFTVNRILQEADTFISVAKMKCHLVCGITLSMKNLVGLMPVQFYRNKEEDWWRSELHNNALERVPRAVVDLNRARPIDLAIIDGVKTCEGGEIPIRGDFAYVEPGLLIAGKNAVATDTVAAALMDFDPTGDYPDSPFLNSLNHLNVAYEAGIGSNHLDDIEVVGVSIDEGRYPFAPATRPT